MPKTNKKFATLMDFLSENSATNVENIKSITETITSLKDLIVEGSNVNERSIESISGELSSLKDLLIEDRNLKSKLIRKEIRLKEISTKSKIINTAFQDELDQIKSKRREIDSEIKSLLQEEKDLQKKEKESQEEKETYFRRTAKSEIESGNLISGLLFSFLGRNEPTKESLEEETKRSDREERRKRLEFLENEKLENQKERKQLRDDIKTTLVTSLSPVAKLLETDAKEEISQQYEQKDIDLSPKPIVIQSIIDPVTVKIEELSKQSLESLKKLLESVEFNTTGSSGGLLQNLPMPIGGAKTAGRMGTILRGGGKLLGKAAVPLTIAYAAYNAYSGVTDEGVNKTLPSRVDKMGKAISTTDRMKSMQSNILSGLTLNIVEPKTIATALETPLGNMIFELSNLLNPLTAIPLILAKIYDKVFGSTSDKDKSKIESPPSSNLKSFTMPMLDLEKDMDPELIKAINKQFQDASEAEMVKRIAHSESGGKNILMTASGDEGYFQFNRKTSPTYLEKIGRSRETKVSDLSAEEQTKMYAEFLTPLRSANIPITPENLKVYGFASGTGLAALSKEQKTGDRSSVIYDKKWLEQRKIDDENRLSSGKQPIYSHFIKMAELSQAGGAITLEGMQAWMRGSKSPKNSMMKMETPITIERVPSAEEKQQPMMKMETPITIERVPSAEELSGYNKTEIVKPTISSEQKISLKPINTPSLSEMNTTSNIRGSQTYEKATESVALKESSMNPGMAVVSNTFNTNNQQISQQQSVRKAPSDTSNPFQNTYNKLIWS
jgi:hypothetical protein